MIKSIASIGGLGLAVAFVAVFFAGRNDSKHLTEVAPRVGMSYDELMAMGPRVASTTTTTIDPAVVRAVQPEPGLLHCVLGFGHGPEHAVGDRLQVVPVPFELAR